MDVCTCIISCILHIQHCLFIQNVQFWSMDHHQFSYMVYIWCQQAEFIVPLHKCTCQQYFVASYNICVQYWIYTCVISHTRGIQDMGTIQIEQNTGWTSGDEGEDWVIAREPTEERQTTAWPEGGRGRWV